MFLDRNDLVMTILLFVQPFGYMFLDRDDFVMTLVLFIHFVLALIWK